MTAESRLAELRKRALAKPCGTRAKYVTGCHCAECTRANREYNAKRVREIIRTGETGELVDAQPARRHIHKLSKRGVGYKQVADAAGVAVSIVCKIRTGQRQHIRKYTADRILAVDLTAAADHALVDAGPTWHILGKLIDDGYRKVWLAQWLGQAGPGLQVGRKQVTVRTAAKVQRLYEDLQAGRIRRER